MDSEGMTTERLATTDEWRRPVPVEGLPPNLPIDFVVVATHFASGQCDPASCATAVDCPNVALAGCSRPSNMEARSAAGGMGKHAASGGNSSSGIVSAGVFCSCNCLPTYCMWR